MTELYIDGVSAVLPKDFSVQVKRENPLFTKNGEYTYDITLPLGNPTNAALYEHLNRLNSVTEVASKRTAILIADNRVYCNGTEIITGWTDESVSIQIASGNSELNYIIGNDLQISSLDGMPDTSDFTESNVRDYVAKRYPEVEYCFPMVYDRDNDEILNPWFVRNLTSPLDLVPGNCTGADAEADTSLFFPQPYLCFFLKYLFEALDYELTDNLLTGTVYEDLFICHAVRTTKWCEMLPGWSVGDFLEQLELMFNGVFVVDNRSRNVRFLAKQKYYHASTTSHVRWVEDMYEVEAAEEDDEPETVNILQSDVCYDFPDNEYWRGRCLPDSVKGSARKKTIDIGAIPPQTGGFVGRMDYWFESEQRQQTDILWTDGETRRKVYYNVEEGAPITGKSHWQLADEFSSITRANPEQEVRLKIMPAEIGQIRKIVGYASVLPYIGYSTKFPMFVIDGGSGGGTESGDDTEGEEAKTPISDLIENSTNAEEENGGSSSSQNNICLAFYVGIALDLNNASIMLPLAYTDEYLYVWDSNTYIQTNTEGKTLRLTDLQTCFWEGTLDVDQRNEIKLTSHDPNLYDPRGVFEIRNKRYVCKEIEYTLDANGRKGAWTGTFYPAKISDTEADARWILADGKWRDGGVWLDNGRWLDS